MPVLGWLTGTTVVEFIEDWDHWIVFALLTLVGSRMILELFRSQGGQGKKVDITKGILLLTLSIATSIDALAVGLSFAFSKVNIALASLTIGLVALLVTAIGFMLGRKASRLIGKHAEAVGGIILIGIGLRVLFSHIL